MSCDPVEVEKKIKSDGAGKGEEVAREAGPPGEPGIYFRAFFRRGVGRG